MRKGKPQQLRKRKADSSEDEGDGGTSKEDKTMASAPANKGASANGGKTEKVTQEFGAPPHLCIDHHLPMALGGHLTPGNLVSLCRKCNELKLDRHPADFYTQEELTRLQPLLDSQESLFAFSFNWDQWILDREAYLLGIGVAKEVVHAALHDELFAGYVGTGEGQAGVTITIDDESLKQLFGTRRQ
jgi:5-methylcytosine-specific restriction endonuclease McrA